MTSKKHIPVVAVHGGAWKIPEELKEGSAFGCRDAASIAYRVMEHGGSCIDAVTAAVSSLEDNPNFDAGKGSVLNENRDIEMHAMIMRGDTCDVGGCIGLKTTKNPVKAARVALEKTHHCLLIGDTATRLAREFSIEEENFEYFLTDYAVKEFENMKNYKASLMDLFNSKTRGHDTVGAVAIDCDGNLACATSTGGITRQVVGRVSDSCLVGSGGFADNEIGAISTTGHGESIMKVNLARMISFNLKQGMYPYTATLQALNHMQRRVGGCGGAICIDLKGNVDICHTTDNMSWAIVDGRKKTGEMVQVRYGVHQKVVREEMISTELIDKHNVLYSLKVNPSSERINIDQNRILQIPESVFELESGSCGSSAQGSSPEGSPQLIMEQDSSDEETRSPYKKQKL